MSTARLVAFAVACGLAGACAAPAPLPATVSTTTATTTAPAEAPRALVSPKLATLDDLGARLEYAPGERVRIGLAADRTTGRRWRIAKLEGDAIAPYGAPVFTAANIRDLRTPGTWIFEFDARSPGDARVNFDYRREGESASASERIAVFEIHVGGFPVR